METENQLLMALVEGLNQQNLSLTLLVTEVALGESAEAVETLRGQLLEIPTIIPGFSPNNLIKLLDNLSKR